MATVALGSERVEATGRAGRAQRLQPLLVALALAGLGIFYAAARTPILPLADPVIYVSSAQALAAGQGYRLPGYLAEPVNTYFPPGYSLFLAAVFKLRPEFPANLPLLELANLLPFYALLALGAAALRRSYRATPLEIALALLLAASTPIALKASTGIMSDSLYGALALGSLLLVQRGPERPGARGLGLLVGGVVLAALAYYTRTAGLALLAALALEGLRRLVLLVSPAALKGGPDAYAKPALQNGRDPSLALPGTLRRESLGRAALLVVPGLLALPWALWTSRNGGSAYLRQLLEGTPGYQLGLNSPENVVRVVQGNLLQGSDVLWTVAPLLVDLWPLACALYLYVAWQSWQRWWRHGDVLSLYVLLYLVMILLWPWRVPGRFLWPLAPLLAWYLLVGTRAAWQWCCARLRRPEWGRPSRRLAGQLTAGEATVAGLVLLVNVVGLAGAAERVAATGWVGEPTPRETYLAMLQTADYLRGLPPDAVLATNHRSTASWWYLYSGHRGLDAVVRGDGLDTFFVQQAAQGDPAAVTHFVYQRDNGQRDGITDDLPWVLAALAARGAPTEPLYCSDDRAVCVYDFSPSPGSAAFLGETPTPREAPPIAVAADATPTRAQP